LEQVAHTKVFSGANCGLQGVDLIYLSGFLFSPSMLLVTNHGW